MAKTRKKHNKTLVQSIYKEIEKFRGKEPIIGNPNTLMGMKKGELNPTVDTVAGILKANGMSASITVEYGGATTTLNLQYNV